MAQAVEPTIYDGTVGLSHNSSLLAQTAVNYMPKFREVVFTATPFLKSLALAAYGKAAAIGETSFGDVMETSKKGIQIDRGGHQFEFPLMTAAPSMSVIGRMGNVNPQFVDPAKTGAYACKKFVTPIFIPEEHLEDNVGKAQLMSRLDTQTRLAKSSAIRDVSYVLLGHSSAPTGATTVGMNRLVSVTQTGSIGGISRTLSWWKNKYKACTSVGGGGQLDRPIQLLRSMDNLLLTIRALSGATNEQTLVGTRGAWQYYNRAAYADKHGTSGVGLKEYYDAGIDHLVFQSRPFIYDGNTQVPWGATASTEAIYFLDYNEFGVNIKENCYFKVEGPEPPRAHDKQRYHQLNLWIRMVPYCTNRRVQGVLYNMPANPDAS
jgi:hypothetical protein